MKVKLTAAVETPRHFITGQDKFPVLLRHRDGSLYLFHDLTCAYCIENTVAFCSSGNFETGMLRATSKQWTVEQGAAITFTQD